MMHRADEYTQPDDFTDTMGEVVHDLADHGIKEPELNEAKVYEEKFSMVEEEILGHVQPTKANKW